jgi:hypothetical protein
MMDRAKALFAQLSRVNFNHAARTDPQQTFMEPLEIVATGLAIRPAAVFGQSAYNNHFLRQLENFAEQNQIHTCRTHAFPVDSELLTLPGLRISRGIMLGIVKALMEESMSRAKEGVLWLYSAPESQIQILKGVEGNAVLGTLLGYPSCCVNYYLGLEATLLQIEFDFYAQKHGARTDDEVLRLRQRNLPPSGDHAQALEAGRYRIQRQQALSIRDFPFNHFIACDECLNNPESPAALLNKAMSDLASNLNQTFARKFTDYARTYFAAFSLNPQV